MEPVKQRFNRTVIAAVVGLAALIPLDASAQTKGPPPKAPAAAKSSRGWFSFASAAPRAPKPLKVEMTPAARTRLRATSMVMHGQAVELHGKDLGVFHSGAKSQRRAAKDLLFPWDGNQLVARHELMEQIERIVHEEANGLHLDEAKLREDWMAVVTGEGPEAEAVKRRDAIFAALPVGKAKEALGRMEARIGQILRRAEEALQPRSEPKPAPASTTAQSGQSTTTAPTSSKQ